MSSLAAKAVKFFLRICTYPCRKKHKSLSRSVTFRQKPYTPPKQYLYEKRRVGGTLTEILSPANGGEGCAVIQFHGGGHTQPMNGMYRKAAERLCRLCGCAVYSVDYQTGKDLAYPSVHDECYAAYIALTDGPLRGKRVAAIGDSFGANLLLSACLRARAEGRALPCALVLPSCYIDMAASGSSYEKNCYADPLYSLPKRQKFEENEKFIRRISPYCKGADLFDPFLSPAYADYGGFPAMLIQCGDAETSESDSDMLYEAAKKAGVRAKLTKYKGMWHDFQYLFPFLKESRCAWQEIADFLTDALRRTPARRA